MDGGQKDIIRKMAGSSGTNAEYYSYEEQDNADSGSIYHTLETKIIPIYYEKDKNGMSPKWLEMMKDSIISTGGNYSTSRMLVDYVEQLYMPLADITGAYYTNLDEVTDFHKWKDETYSNWNDITITQIKSLDNIVIDAGNKIDVSCKVKLPNIEVGHIQAEVYYGKVLENGVLERVDIIPMNLIESDEGKKEYIYTAKIELSTGGNYGYTFRVVPKHPMLLDSANLNLIKWITS